MANYLCPPVVKEREMVLFWSGGARETHLGGCILCIVTVSAVYRLFTWFPAPSLDISENINYDWDQPAAAALSPWADHLTVWQVAPRPLTSPPHPTFLRSHFIIPCCRISGHSRTIVVFIMLMRALWSPVVRDTRDGAGGSKEIATGVIFANKGSWN